MLQHICKKGESHFLLPSRDVAALCKHYVIISVIMIYDTVLIFYYKLPSFTAYHMIQSLFSCIQKYTDMFKDGEMDLAYTHSRLTNSEILRFLCSNAQFRSASDNFIKRT